MAFCIPFAGGSQTNNVPPDILAIVGAKIYPAPYAEPFVNGVILVKGEKISQVGTKEDITTATNANILDGTGLSITAGLWNSHVHFMEPKWQNADGIPAQQLNEPLSDILTRYGFTYAFDLATLDLSNLIALRKRIETGQVKGPNILTAGVPFKPPNGNPIYTAPLKLPELGVPEHARQHVRDQISSGADAIKLWSASPNGETIITMPPEILLAATNMAHALEKPVFCTPDQSERSIHRHQWQGGHSDTCGRRGRKGLAGVNYQTNDRFRNGTYLYFKVA